MKKKELRNVMRKNRIQSAMKTIATHEHILRTFSIKDMEWLESEECPWDWEKSKSLYNEAKEFLKTIK